jgi:two-component system phosphate regulon sensor histidine kinase PhoR
METAQNPLERTKFLKIIEKNVTRMTSIINDLLSLAQIEIMQNNDIKFKNYDLIPIMEKVAEDCQTRSWQKKIKINKNLPEKLVIPIDPFLIEQTIINLVDNAIKYSGTETEISINAFKKDEYAVIEIKDSGPGIKAEHLLKIFNRFYRVDKARSRDTGGTGLGLAIVKHIAMYHNGKAQVKSIKGKGSVFSIKLPLN